MTFTASTATPRSGAWSGVSLTAFAAAVDSTRATVTRVLVSRGNADVDDVLQQTREVLWHKIESGEFDPARGSLGAFANGIASRLSRRVLERSRPTFELFERAASTVSPLDGLIAEFEMSRFLEALADLLGPRDWSIVVDCALEEASTAFVAMSQSLSERTVQDVRSWGLCAAASLWKAFEMADAGMPATRAAILSCVPSASRVRQVMHHTFGPHRSAPQVAQAEGLPTAEARRSLSRARRLQAALTSILEGN